MTRTEINVQTGEQRIIEVSPEEIAALQAAEQSRLAAIPYTEKRRNEYPLIQDQLDLLYWDKVNGTNNWQTAIQAVKDKYPKP
jgi:hypothetical protein